MYTFKSEDHTIWGKPIYIYTYVYVHIMQKYMEYL